jgi:predicted RNA-binding protein with PUA-like domain
MKWLFKEEPSNYNFAELMKDGRTVWAGVRNPLAQKYLREIKKGDQIYYYHTGAEKAVVGIARAAGNSYPDADDATGKAVVVDVIPERPLRRPVTLKEIKASKTLTTFVLTRAPRLSVMPVTEREWTEIEKMSRE